MNIKKRSIIINTIILFFISCCLYLFHFIFFREILSTISAIIISLAFIPVQMIFDTLVIDNIMERREKSKREKKINMIVGSFYNILGNELLSFLVDVDPDNPSIKSLTKVSKGCCDDDFCNLKYDLLEYDFKINIEEIDLERLKDILLKNNSFLVDLMISSVIDEDEEFSKMIMSVAHLRDELTSRMKNKSLYEYEFIHIKADIEYSYKLLTNQWVDYMKHLKKFYKELFIKALIESPFDDRSKIDKDREYL